LRIRDLVRDVAGLVFREAISVDFTEGQGGLVAVDVNVSSREPGAVIMQAGAAMQALFHAVGKANGRTLRVTIVPEPETENATALVARKCGVK